MLSEAVIQKIWELREQGKTPKQIADILRKPYAKVKTIVKSEIGVRA